MTAQPCHCGKPTEAGVAECIECIKAGIRRLFGGWGVSPTAAP